MSRQHVPRAQLLVELPARRYRILSPGGRAPQIGDEVELDQGFTSSDGRPMGLVYLSGPDGEDLYEAEVYDTELGPRRMNQFRRHTQMTIKPPLPLVVAAILYLACLAWMLMVDLSPVVAGRLAISAILFFFVFRGSRVAGNILAILCALSALVLLVAAVATFSTGTLGAVLFTVMAGLLMAFAAYLFFSPAVRAFQDKASQARAP